MTIKSKQKVIFPIFMFFLPRVCFGSTCGLEGGLKSRISGGETARPNQYPWMVRFTYYKQIEYYKGEEPYAYQCAGSLITDRLVLTARHCVKNFGKWGEAQAGIHTWGDEKNNFQTIQFEDILLHDTMDGYNDIAILVVKDPVDLGDPRIGTVCLPESENQMYRGEPARAMGWGMMTNKEMGKTLKHVNLQVNNEQEKYWLYTDVPFINGEYQDACAGDSGGPLVHRQGPQWTVIGVVSGGGYDCKDGRINGLGKWNKVTAHLNWIKNIINQYTVNRLGVHQPNVNMGYPGSFNAIPNMGYPGSINSLPNMGYPASINPMPNMGYPGSMNPMPNMVNPPNINPMPNMVNHASVNPMPNMVNPANINPMPNRINPANINAIPNMGYPGNINAIPNTDYPGSINPIPNMGYPGSITPIPNMVNPGSINAIPNMGYPGSINANPNIRNTHLGKTD